MMVAKDDLFIVGPDVDPPTPGCTVVSRSMR
jgi:hypothetical protein